MLIQFNFKNYKSFRDEVSLDLTATRVAGHPDHVVELGGDKLLLIAAIFGANASGKSCIYSAFNFMSYYVANSFSFGGDSNTSKGQSSMLRVTPYMFDSVSRMEPTSFEVFFIDSTDTKERTYQYGFSILGTEIMEEWLYSKAKTARNHYRTIFCRKKDEPLQTDGLTDKEREILISTLEPETLLVSLGAKLKISRLKRIRDWFLSNEIVDFGDPDENLFRSHMLPRNFTDSKEVQDNVIHYFSTFDDSISGFHIEEVQNADSVNENDKTYKIDSLHHMDDSDKEATIPLQDESSGTLKMFALYPSLKEVLDHGSVMFVDELNAKLHPLLVRNIILTFTNPEINVNHAQLIFTTHDIWQFSGDLLRRDEIWITEKQKGRSSLYSVVDFIGEDGAKVRKSEALSKNYLLGEYGGIPALHPFDMLKGTDSSGRK